MASEWQINRHPRLLAIKMIREQTSLAKGLAQQSTISTDTRRQWWIQAEHSRLKSGLIYTNTCVNIHIHKYFNFIYFEMIQRSKHILLWWLTFVVSVNYKNYLYNSPKSVSINYSKENIIWQQIPLRAPFVIFTLIYKYTFRIITYVVFLSKLCRKL